MAKNHKFVIVNMLFFCPIFVDYIVHRWVDNPMGNVCNKFYK